MDETGTLNIHGRSKNRTARLLSAFCNRAFEFGGLVFASFEGFFNGILYQEGDPRRLLAFASTSQQAQDFGEGVQHEVVYWQGSVITAGSEEYIALIRAAHRASILQCEDRKQALIATAGLILTHDVETPPNPHYPPELFAQHQMEFRAELLGQ